MDRAHEIPSEEDAVRRVIEEWARAVRAKDMAGILRNHSPDMLMFDVPPPLALKGIAAYEKSWGPFFAWARQPVTFDIEEMTVTAGADVAFAAASMRCAGHEASGEDVELEFRLTVGLRKIDGNWVILHEHHSVPAVD